MFAVETDALTRTYSVGSAAAPIVALRDVSLTINEGEVHGLLGPNGAGKTTLVKILSTVLLPTSGRALVHGYDVGRAPSLVRPLIGLVFGGDKGLYQRLTGRQNLEYWGSALSGSHMAEAEALCDRVALIDHGRLLAVETPARLAEYVARYERIDFDGATDEST